MITVRCYGPAAILHSTAIGLLFVTPSTPFRFLVSSNGRYQIPLGE